MTEPGDQFRWGSLVVECARRLQQPTADSAAFVDFEVIPPLDGSPDGMFVWFICAKRADVPPLRARSLESATVTLRELLAVEGFPATGASSLRTDVTSLEEIEAAGGRFNYFR